MNAPAAIGRFGELPGIDGEQRKLRRDDLPRLQAGVNEALDL